MMNTQLISTYRVVSRLASGIVIAIGLLVLMGWFFKIPALPSILPGLATMKANSALAFVLASISLWQVIGEDRDQRSNPIAIVCAAITMLIGLLTLGEYIFGREFGIDQLLFKDELTPQNAYPGRMSPATALNFFLLGCALLVIDIRWSNWINESLTITALMIAAVAVIGYIYGVSSLYKIGLYASMAVHTAVTFIVLCVGILSARPERGLISILTTEGAAGILARRLLPAAIGLPIVLGWLILRGQRLGEYDTAFGIALFALLNLIIFSGLIRWNADMLHRAEVERIQARNALLDNEKRSRQFFENMHEAFVIQEIMMDNNGRPIDLRFLDLNPAAERMLGKTRSELVGRTRSEIAGRPDPEGVEMASRVASTGMPIHMVRSSPGFGRSFESFTYSLGSEIVATLSLDITERKKAEDALRQSEANKSSIVESALDCIITIDHQGRVLEFNPAAQETFGYTRAEAIGKEMAELIIPPLLRERHRRGLARYLSTGEGPVLGKRIEISGMRADGTEFPLELAITPVRGEDPPIFTGFLRDITEGKRADELIRGSEERFRLIVEAAPSAMIAVDRDGKIDLVNAKAQELFGYREEELLGRPVEMLVPQRFRSGHANYRQSFLAQPTSRPMGAGRDLFGLHKDGHEIPIEIGLTPYESSESQFTIALIVDITERKRAEEELHKSEERYRFLFENNPLPMWVYDLKTLAFLAVNDSAVERYGYTREEFLHMIIADIRPLEEVSRLMEDVAKQRPTLQHAGGWRHRLKDGTIIEVEITSHSLRIDEHDAALVVALDITERKRAEEKIAYQAYLLENVNDAVIGSDENALIRFWNQGAERIFGWKAEEVLGRSAREILRSEFLNTDRETVLKILAEQGRWRGESILYRQDGSKVIMEVSSITLRDVSGLITGYVSVNRDISERKRDEDALRERESYAHSLLNLSRKLEQAQTYSETLDAALDQVKTVLGYRNVWTYLLSEDRQSLRLLTTTGELSQMITNDFPTLPIKGDRFLEEIAAGKDIVLVEDARTDPRTNKDIVAQLGNRTIVNVPIVLMDRHLGAFGTGSFGEEGVRVPTSTQLDYLHSLASHMAVTLDRIHLLLERKRAEKQNRFLANLVASVSDAIIAVDLQQNIQSWNIGAEAMYGWKEDEVLGRPVKEILVTDFLEAKRELVTKQIMEQGNWAGEVVQLRRDGTRIPTLSSVALYKDSEGKPAGIVAVNRDITDRKQSEEEIRKLNEGLEQRVADRTAALSHANSLLQILLDHMPDQIYFKDAQSRFIRNSMSQAKALGLSDPAEAVGKSDFDFFPHAQQSFDKEQEIIRSGKPLVDEEERVVWPDGRETWVSTTKMPLLDQAGQIIGTFGISRDITDRKRAEIALQKAKLEMEAANKELEAFSYSVSHDLRAPLRSVDGFSQALLEDYGEMLPPDGRNFLERIRSSAQRMAELIDDLLNLSKVTRAAMKLVPVDLSQIAQGIAEELQNTHRERKVNFNITPNLKVRGDPNLLRIVLENLLNNAWKFTSKQEQAEIEVGSKSENGETFYFIRDNGAGFDMAYVGKLFGAFQRLHAMTEYSGTGIGLATVQRIINRHGGRIWAEGVVDQGATFFFTLPALERVRPQAATIEKDSLDTRVREII